MHHQNTNDTENIKTSNKNHHEMFSSIKSLVK